MKSCNDETGFAAARVQAPAGQDSEFIRSEIPDIARIVQDECWLEGERRGAFVSPHDVIVQRRVAEIILAEAGALIRQRHSTED